MSQNNNIYLLGFMGVGKSTIGKLLSEKFNRPFFDIDELIVNSIGKPITMIFEENGEQHFRLLESGVLQSVAQENNAVISCGGGIILREDNMKIIRETGRSVFLSASIETHIERLGDSTDRPILDGVSADELPGKMKKVLAVRLPHYLTADLTLDTNDKSPETIVDDLIGKLEL